MEVIEAVDLTRESVSSSATGRQSSARPTQISTPRKDHLITPAQSMKRTRITNVGSDDDHSPSTRTQHSLSGTGSRSPHNPSDNHKHRSSAGSRESAAPMFSTPPKTPLKHFTSFGEDHTSKPYKQRLDGSKKGFHMPPVPPLEISRPQDQTSTKPSSYAGRRDNKDHASSSKKPSGSTSQPTTPSSSLTAKFPMQSSQSCSGLSPIDMYRKRFSIRPTPSQSQSQQDDSRLPTPSPSPLSKRRVSIHSSITDTRADLSFSFDGASDEPITSVEFEGTSEPDQRQAAGQENSTVSSPGGKLPNVIEEQGIADTANSQKLSAARSLQADDKTSQCLYCLRSDGRLQEAEWAIAQLQSELAELKSTLTSSPPVATTSSAPDVSPGANSDQRPAEKVAQPVAPKMVPDIRDETRDASVTNEYRDRLAKLEESMDFIRKWMAV